MSTRCGFFIEEACSGQRGEVGLGLVTRSVRKCGGRFGVLVGFFSSAGMVFVFATFGLRDSNMNNGW